MQGRARLEMESKLRFLILACIFALAAARISSSGVNLFSSCKGNPAIKDWREKGLP